MRNHVVTSERKWGLPNFIELWHYRDLLGMFIMRDIKVRYRQTVIGILWAVIQPVMQMVVFTLIFGKLGNLPSDDQPYPAFVLAGLLPWQLFQKALTQGGTSMVTIGGIMSKVYFPRLIAPVASVLSGAADFAIALIILLLVMLYYGITPGVEFLLLPVFVALTFMSALSFSIWLAAINSEYRDVQHALPFLAQILMFLTPVLYPTSFVPKQYEFIYALNPMVSSIDGFRWALLGTPPPDLASFALSTGLAFALLLSGLIYFNRYEKNFVDRL
jgi:lipopolysaccharide transport system permease protein